MEERASREVRLLQGHVEETHGAEKEPDRFSLVPWISTALCSQRNKEMFSGQQGLPPGNRDLKKAGDSHEFPDDGFFLLMYREGK